MPKVSVIVPAYNAELTIEKCIIALTEQTFDDYEIIVVNDGSTDHTSDICKEIAKLKNNVKVIDKVNGGVSSARNCGMKYAKGEYIAFCDCDDLPCLDWIEYLVRSIEANNADLAVCNYELIHDINDAKTIYKNSNKIELIEKNNIWCLYEKNLLNTPWNKLFKRNIILSLNLTFDETFSFGEDLLFICNYIIGCKGNVSYCYKKLYNYLEGNIGSLSNKTVDDLWYSRKYIQNVLTEMLGICNVDLESIKKSYYTKWIDVIMLCLRNAEGYSSKEKFKKESRDIFKDEICKKAFKYGEFVGLNAIAKYIYKTRSLTLIQFYKKIASLHNGHE